MRLLPTYSFGSILFLLSLPAVFPQTQTASAADVAVKIVTDRENAIYDVGEKATFQISVEGDDVDGTLDYRVDDYLVGGTDAGMPEGKAELKDGTAEVTVSGTKPGFLRCQVTFTPAKGKPIKAVAGAAFSPTEIELSMPVPDDFDAFWNEQKRLLAEVPLDPELTPMEFRDETIECFDVQVQCLGDAPVSGYFAKPKDAEAKSCPAILWVHGAGVRSSSFSNAVKGATAGMLSMDINAHGLPNGKPASFYAQQSGGPLKNYRHAGREDRETIYFRGMYLRLVRAIDFLTAQPEWDGKHVVVVGHSQGGGQSLVAGGLDNRVTMIAPGVPAICDHSGAVAGRVNGWPKLVPNGEDGKPDPKILNAARYVDAVNFAPRCNAETVMSVGFIDSVCPPSSCYAAFNALTGKKQMFTEPLMGHAAPPHIQEAFFNRILEHVQGQPAETAR